MVALCPPLDAACACAQCGFGLCHLALFELKRRFYRRLWFVIEERKMFYFRRWMVLLVLLITLLTFHVGLAQNNNVLTVTKVDTSAYPQIQVLLSAPNGDLPDPSTIQVTEDGNVIAADQVEAEERRTGVAVAVLVDATRSMRGQGMPGSTDRMQDAREQAIAIAQALDFDTDLISIFAFHRDVVTVMPLERVDGGAVANTVNTAEVLGPIPDKPGGAARRPTVDDLLADERAFSSFSPAVSRAIDELTNPQTSDTYILEMLPRMQKVIVILSDGCDDTLDAPGTATCTIPLDVQTKLQDVIREGNLSIFSVGLGSTNANQSNPRPPLQADAGFRYASRFELLQLYAQQVPNSHFFPLFTNDPNQADALRESFRSEILEAMVNRGDQVIVRYTSQVGSAGQQRRIQINDATRQVRTQFEEPRIPPSVTIIGEQRGDQLLIRPETLYSQAPLARVDYYIDGNTVPIPGDPPMFALDLSHVEPGARRISLEATDQRGDRSVRSQELPVDVPVPPTPVPSSIFSPGTPDRELTFVEAMNLFLFNNIISLITLFIVIVLAVFVLINPRGRAAAVQVGSRVTGVIQRMTRPISATSSIGAAADFVLVVRQGGTIGAEYPLPNLNTYIGADPSLVDIVLSDPHVSGRHASVNREGDDLFVTDLGSTNGTLVNRQQLPPNTRVPLQVKDMLTIGGMTMECVWRGAAAQGPAVEPSSVAQQPTVAYQPGQNNGNN
ncbi:MAG: FHA domain-containing protein [Candidatus Viridilinea halotolerans]|uniref:FHA domain-containing protein n=1 Tax=Candidatus Viridilinea halotolerans TaxID=2491704 RepID=A0A426TZA5_9CHLR|nr:MAG: FHA domain-containing protein [Candidatus Viridilinea halotolerans]